MADPLLNTNPTYTVSHTFSTDDVSGTFDGLTQGDIGPGDAPIIDFSATPRETKEGVSLYPINSEFGFVVTDFDGAVQKDFVANPEFAEGWAGDLTGPGGEQLGIVVSDAPTDTFKTPAVLGTWLAGLGGNSVKASTEHYVVMQHILSDQAFPGDPSALYPLDDNLVVIGGTYDGQLVADVIPLVGDVNGDGEMDIRDVLEPNEATITENIAASSDYSVTLKDDGKLLYRWGNMIKKPNDIRLEVEMPLPEEWTETEASTPDLLPLFWVTQAELVVRHTVTNNPNDQIRPEDYENESAIGQLPTYEILADGRWVSTDDYYAGDGTLYPAGTVLRDPAIATAATGSTLDQIGAMSSDLEFGFTNAWYTTMDREPFEADLNDAGTDYDVGPRWRLQPNKYGQDLPGVVIPQDPSAPLPVQNGEEKYEVGADTQTVINLLDWEYPASPLSLSAGWQNNSGTVSGNGLNLTQNFDVAFYIKGDIKPATLYDTQLVMSYEEVTIHGTAATVFGGAGTDILVGMGGNTMTGDAGVPGIGEDVFVLSYGTEDDAWSGIMSTTVTDFDLGSDTLALIDLGVDSSNFDSVVSQTVVAGDLQISLGGTQIALLQGVGEMLEMTDFLLLNRGAVETDPDPDPDPEPDPDDKPSPEDYDNVITGDDGANVLYGTAEADWIDGGGGNDKIVGRGEDDYIIAGAGRDYYVLGGAGADVFQFATGDEVVKIHDFEDGLDQICLVGGLTYDDLTRTVTTYNGIVTANFYTPDGDRLLLQNVDPATIDHNDFLIA